MCDDKRGGGAADTTQSRRLVVQSGRYLSSPRIPTTTVAAVCWDSQPFAGLLRGTKNYAVHHNGVHLLLELNYRGGRWLLSTMGRNAFTRRAVEVGLLGTDRYHLSRSCARARCDPSWYVVWHPSKKARLKGKGASRGHGTGAAYIHRPRMNTDCGSAITLCVTQCENAFSVVLRHEALQQ